MVYVGAPEVLLPHGRVLKLDPALEQFPYFLLVIGVTSKLEVINVDAENSPKLRVSVAAGPVRDGQKACFAQLPVTMLLPACAGIWVTIER